MSMAPLQGYQEMIKFASNAASAAAVTAELLELPSS